MSGFRKGGGHSLCFVFCLSTKLSVCMYRTSIQKPLLLPCISLQGYRNRAGGGKVIIHESTDTYSPLILDTQTHTQAHTRTHKVTVFMSQGLSSFVLRYSGLCLCVSHQISQSLYYESTRTHSHTHTYTCIHTQRE